MIRIRNAIVRYGGSGLCTIVLRCIIDCVLVLDSFRGSVYVGAGGTCSPRFIRTFMF